MKDLYFDLANPGSCQNADHGCVWKDDFGRQMNDWAVLQTRELHKRIYRLVKAKNPDGAMYGHVCSRRGPSDVFFDMICMGEGYAYRTRKTDRKMYWIDEDIVTALKACDINRMSATDIINAILRSFIELNKEELRECFKHHDSLI